MRMVTHLDVNRPMIERALEIIAHAATKQAVAH
jgi:hypothetical protein